MAGVRLIGELASLKGSRPRLLVGLFLLLQEHTHPGSGAALRTPRWTQASLCTGLGAWCSIAPLWPPEPTVEGGGGACALGLAAGRQQADHGPGIGAGKRLALKPRNCRL